MLTRRGEFVLAKAAPAQPAQAAQPAEAAEPHPGFGLENSSSPISHCRAKDPARCPYHGWMAENRGLQDVRGDQITELRAAHQGLTEHLNEKHQYGEPVSQTRLHALEVARQRLEHAHHENSRGEPDHEMLHGHVSAAQDAIHRVAQLERVGGLAGFPSREDPADARSGDRVYPGLDGSSRAKKRSKWHIPIAQLGSAGYSMGFAGEQPMGFGQVLTPPVALATAQVHGIVNRDRDTNLAEQAGYATTQAERLGTYGAQRWNREEEERRAAFQRLIEAQRQAMARGDVYQ